MELFFAVPQGPVRCSRPMPPTHRHCHRQKNWSDYLAARRKEAHHNFSRCFTSLSFKKPKYLCNLQTGRRSENRCPGGDVHRVGPIPARSDNVNCIIDTFNLHSTIDHRPRQSHNLHRSKYYPQTPVLKFQRPKSQIERHTSSKVSPFTRKSTRKALIRASFASSIKSLRLASASSSERSTPFIRVSIT